jgi:hypothetical protein
MHQKVHPHFCARLSGPNVHDHGPEAVVGEPPLDLLNAKDLRWRHKVRAQCAQPATEIAHARVVKPSTRELSDYLLKVVGKVLPRRQQLIEPRRPTWWRGGPGGEAPVDQ